MFSSCRFVFAILCFAVLVMQFSAVHAEDWAGKEARVGKALYIPEIKIVKPEQMPNGLANNLQKLGMDVVYVEQKVSPGRYACTPIAQSDMGSMLDVLAGALDKIPATAVRKAQLKYLMLCDESFAQGAVIGGIPVPPLKLLMLSMGGVDVAYQEHIFFHELYHYMEFMTRRGINDPKWNSKFQGYGGRSMNWALGSGSRDFVSAYAQVKPEEDRAEIFAHMMHDPKGFANYVKIQNSDILSDKAAYIHNIAVTEFGIDNLQR